jgi:hypothetical protein
MTTYVIKNRVPSAEEMGQKLGLSASRINTVRFIMSSPSSTKTSKRHGAVSETAARTSKRLDGKYRVGTSGKKLNAKQLTSRASGTQ